jgi:hypothetical protein
MSGEGGVVGWAKSGFKSFGDYFVIRRGQKYIYINGRGLVTFVARPKLLMSIAIA